MKTKEQIIAELVEGLEAISDMPDYDDEIGLGIRQVAAQYGNAVETARETLAKYHDAMAEIKRVESLKSQGVSVCDNQCATCTRQICTGAKNLSGRVG